MLGVGIGIAARGARLPGLGLAVTAGLLGLAVVAARAGAYDALSLAVEYRARRELGFAPAIALEAGMAEQLAWLRSGAA